MSGEELSDHRLIALLRHVETQDRSETTDSAAALSARVIADFDAVSRRAWLARSKTFVSRLVDATWPGAPVWKPAAALGLSLLIGLGVGALLPVAAAPDDSSVASDASPGIDFGGDLR
jgi:hypothetical protein